MRKVNLYLEGTKTEKARFAEQLERAAEADAKSSTAEKNKVLETLIRRYSKAQPMNKREYRARSCKKLLDLIIKLSGITYRIEIKVGNGVLVYHDATYGGNELDYYTSDEVLPNIDLIFWAPYTDETDYINFPDMVHVFTRAQFLKMLGEMLAVKKAKGEFFIPESYVEDLGLKYCPQKSCWNIPTFKNCAGKRWVIDSWLDRTPTLRTFIPESVRRA